ncbi:hypothetical protein [Haloferula sp. BvORR071]|uniref:hypothetical protein n=1 Tax=Haloferula sp. BvORR071 TaxID=1396141 RepID=UPI00055181F6|nr:hypothetical protein [Haloferula sp. BvORR071]
MGSTQLGLRTEGWREVTVEVAKPPSYEQVGQNLFTPDGTRIILNSITPGDGNYGGKHFICANVRVTNRLTLNPFPLHMVSSYAMDQVAVERTVREAVGADPGKFQPSQREWHPVL